MGRTVALVSSSFFPNIGGVAEHTLHTAQDLMSRAYEVEVWTPDHGDRRPATRHRGVTVRYLPTPALGGLGLGIFSYLLAAPGAAAAWRRAWEELRPDVLHVHGFAENGTYARRLARRTGTPLIISSHGETFQTDDGGFESSRSLRRSLRSGLRQAAAVTACSAYAGRDLERFGRDSGLVRVVYDGIDPDEQGTDRPDRLPGEYILGVGKMVEMNGFDLLLHAFAHASLPASIRLVLAGDGPHLAELERLTASLGIERQVVFTGALDRPAVVATISGALMLAVPSRVEPFGLVVLEGWRGGVPVIATSVGGPQEFVADGEDAILVDPTDEPTLTRTIERVAADAALREQLAAAGALRVEDFTWSDVGGAYSDLYAEIRGSRIVATNT